MFADIAHFPLCKDFYKDGCIYTTIEGGLTAGDGDTFMRVPENIEKFPIIKGESLGGWAERHGEPLYQAIRDYKPINKAKFNAAIKAQAAIAVS